MNGGTATGSPIWLTFQNPYSSVGRVRNVLKYGAMLGSIEWIGG